MINNTQLWLQGTYSPARYSSLYHWVGQGRDMYTMEDKINLAGDGENSLHRGDVRACS